MKYGKRDVRDKLERTGSAEVRQKNRFLMFLVVLGIGLVVSAAVIAAAIAVGAYTQIISDTPVIRSIGDLEPKENKSIIYASDGSVMQELVVSGSNRINVSYDEIPRDLVNAVVAIEDARFFEHQGVDVKGVFRAIFVGLTKGNLSEGASTITQQLIKNNMYGGGFETNLGDRVTRKFQEQYLALQLEQRVDKKTILEYYLNTINFGANSLGVEVAAQRYFGKHVSALSLAECTVIAATTSSPTRYNPITHPDSNQIRRLIILDKMLEEGYISEAQRAEAAKEDVYQRIQATAEAYQGQHAFSYFTDAVFDDVLKALQKELGYTENQAYGVMYNGGLRIYTTEVPSIQAVIDEEVNNDANYFSRGADGLTDFILQYSLSYTLGIRTAGGSEYYYNETSILNYFRDTLGKRDFTLIFDTLDSLNESVTVFRDYIVAETRGEIIAENVTATKEPQASVVVVDQRTGYVLGISGGRGNKDEMGSRVLNRATQSTRQPGSTFKILTTYAPAIDLKGATLGSTYYDSEYLLDGRPVRNWWGEPYLGYANVRQAIMASMNIIAIRCMENTVTESLAYDYARSFGISTLVPNDKSPVLAIGGITYGVTNLELTGAYASIANMGVYNEPIFWTRVTDTEGNLILENVQEQKTVIREETAKLLTSAMEDVITPQWTAFPREGVGATNTSLAIEGVHVAGKSGTTNDVNDLWFVGFSPYYTLGVWSGYDSGIVLGDGWNTHRYLWRNIMTRISEGLEDTEFDYSGLVKAKICSKSGLLAREGVCDRCGDEDCHVYEEYFSPNTVPTEYCNRHAEFSICSESGKLANNYCPLGSVTRKVYLKLGQSELNDSCETVDLAFVIPEELQNSTCNVHFKGWDETTEAPTDEEPEEDETAAQDRNGPEDSGESDGSP